MRIGIRGSAGAIDSAMPLCYTSISNDTAGWKGGREASDLGQLAPVCPCGFRV
jgi:hypothetical protein